MPGNLYRRGRIWWGRVQVAGREHRRSLRTHDRAEAKKRLAEWIKEASHTRFHGEPRLTWKAASLRYTTEAAGSVKPDTMKRYISSFAQVDGILGEMYVDEITRRTVGKIISTGRQRGATNATIRRDLTAVSRVLALCVAYGEREDNPAKEFDKEVIRERRSPRRLPEPDQVRAYAAACHGNLRHLVMLLWQTGMRLEEAVGLERGQIRIHDAVIDLHETKTDAPRAVPLSDAAVGTITGTPIWSPPVAPIGRKRWVFWHGQGERYLNASSNLQQVRRRLKIAWTVHDLRHLFAVEYLRERRGSIYDLQQALGHSSIRTTEIYLKYLTADEAAEAKRPAQKLAQ